MSTEATTTAAVDENEPEKSKRTFGGLLLDAALGLAIISIVFWGLSWLAMDFVLEGTRHLVDGQIDSDDLHNNFNTFTSIWSLCTILGFIVFALSFAAYMDEKSKSMRRDLKFIISGAAAFMVAFALELSILIWARQKLDYEGLNDLRNILGILAIASGVVLVPGAVIYAFRHQNDVPEEKEEFHTYTGHVVSISQPYVDGGESRVQLKLKLDDDKPERAFTIRVGLDPVAIQETQVGDHVEITTVAILESIIAKFVNLGTASTNSVPGVTE